MSRLDEVSRLFRSPWPVLVENIYLRVLLEDWGCPGFPLVRDAEVLWAHREGKAAAQWYSCPCLPGAVGGVLCTCF